MRHCLLVFLLACSGSGPKTVAPTPGSGEPPVADPAKPAPPAAPKGEVMAADTPTTTVGGNTFVAPAGWTLLVRGQATIISAPEGDTHVAIVDVKAKDSDAAVDLAWAAYGKEKKWPLELKDSAPDRDGWSKITV